MNILTGKTLPRRTFLKGAGAVVALPYLDAMLPATGVGRKAASPDAIPTRFVAIEVVHGAAGSNAYGASKFLWAPQGTGKDFEIVNDSALTPLRGWRDYLTIISNTDVRMADPIGNAAEMGGDHFRSSAAFLTQSHPKQTNGSDLYVGMSIDQIIARRIGKDSPLPSMQLGIENVDQAGGCSYNYSCAYTDTVSWATPSDPLPMIRDPRIAFDMLFGKGANNADRASRRSQDASVLDWIASDVASLKREVGRDDARRVDQYVDSIREVERRIQAIEVHNTSGEARAIPEAPPAVPDSFSEHMKLMFDVQVLAMQADMTRVFSFKTGRDLSNRTYPESGTRGSFHGLSHHGGTAAKVTEFNLINRYYVSLLPYFLQKLKDAKEGDSDLLEKTMIVYGSPMGDSNLHNHRRCPLLVLGHANGALTGNIHVQAPDQTPMANAMLSLLHGMGMNDSYFGDSTSALPLRG